MLTKYRTDVHGFFVETIDHNGHSTKYERNADGLVTKRTDLDPDGAGPLVGLETTYTYATTRGDRLTETKKAVGSSTILAHQQWFYADADYGIPTKHIDELGRVTKYTVGPKTGNINQRGKILSMTQVVGQEDATANGESDDVTTRYAYATFGSHVGLLSAMTDPLGRVTKYDYFVTTAPVQKYEGLLKRVTYNFGTAQATFFDYEYFDARTVKATIDELGRRTDFEYDNLDRLTKHSDPDPDLIPGGSNGPLPRPVTDYRYDAVGNQTKIINALSNVTSTIFDAQNRVEMLIRPRPESTAAYTKTIEDGAATEGDGSGFSSTGNWTTTTGGSGGSHRYHSDAAAATATWTFNSLTAAKRYEVFIAWPKDSANLTAAQFQVLDGSSSVLKTVSVNQQVAPSSDYASTVWWRPLGTFTGQASLKVKLSALASQRVAADAVRILEVGPTDTYAYDAAGNLSSTTDTLGNKTDYRYDNLNRRDQVTLPDPDGPNPLTRPVTTTVYYADGNIKTVTDPLSNVAEYKHDELHRVIEVIQPDPDGPQTSPITKYAYDAAGQLTATTDPMGRVTRYDYDDLGRQTVTIAPFPGTSPSTTTIDETATSWSSGTGGYDNDYRYRGQGTASHYTDWTFTVDTSKTYEVLATWQVFSANSTVAPYQIINGSTDTTQRVNQKYVPSDVQTSEQSQTFNWHRLGVFKPTSTTFTVRLRADIESGAQVVADAVRLIEVGSTQQTTYDKNGNVATTIDPLGNITFYDYDHRDRQTAVILPLATGTPSNRSSDDSGTVPHYQYGTWTTDTSAGKYGDHRYATAGSASTTSVHDYAYSLDANKTYQVFVRWVPSELNATDVKYDLYFGGWNTTISVNQQVAPCDYFDEQGFGWHRLTTFTGQTHNAVRVNATTSVGSGSATRVDDDGVLLLHMDSSTKTGYDAVGNATSLTDGEGNVTTFAYDGLNRKTSETNSLGKARSFAYDSLDRMTKETLRHTGTSKTIEHVFDNLGRETQELWKNGTTTVRTLDYGYDAASRLTSANDSDASARDFLFEHDNLGRVKESEWSAAGRLYTMTNTYDAASRRTERNLGYDPGPPYYPAPNWLIDSWQYDKLNRVTMATQGGHYTILPKRAEFAYHADSQLAEIKRFNAATGGTAIVDSDYGYDNAGRLTSLAHKNAAGTTTYVGYGYTYDRANRITAVDFSSSVITGINAEDATYAYDRNAQLTSADRSATDESYAYDENGNRAMSGWVTGANNRLTEDPTFTYTYDEEGNRLTRVRKSGAAANDKTVEYSWDHRNRLTQVLHKNNAGTVTMRVQYHYDMFDRMVERVHDPDGDTGSQQVVNEYFLHDGDERIMHMLSAYGESHIYMFNPVNNELLFDQTGVNYATLTDHLGTVRDFVNPSGLIVNHTIYDSYGNRLSETNPQGGAVPHRSQYGFTGEYFDLATGLNYHHHRWYDLAAGRWISEDPIGFAGGDANLSRYVANSPTLYVDPSGLKLTIGVQGSRTRGLAADVTWYGAAYGSFRNSLASPFVAIAGICTGALDGGELLDTAYEMSPLGQTEDADGLTYWGTRGGLIAAAVAGASAAGLAWWAASGGPTLLAEGGIMGGRISSGGIFQIRPAGGSPWFRIDWHNVNIVGGPKGRVPVTYSDRRCRTLTSHHGEFITSHGGHQFGSKMDVIKSPSELRRCADALRDGMLPLDSIRYDKRDRRLSFSVWTKNPSQVLDLHRCCFVFGWRVFAGRRWNITFAHIDDFQTHVLPSAIRTSIFSLGGIKRNDNGRLIIDTYDGLTLEAHAESLQAQFDRTDELSTTLTFRRLIVWNPWRGSIGKQV